MERFNRSLAEQHVNKLLKFYNISVRRWRRGPSGRAWEDNTVEIPKPIDAEKLCVALHEIGHIRQGFRGLNYVQEYNAEQYAIREATRLGFDTTEYEDRAKWYVTMHICRGFRRKLQVKNIPQEIKDWCGINFDQWELERKNGLKPWVHRTAGYVTFA